MATRDVGWRHRWMQRRLHGLAAHGAEQEAIVREMKAVLSRYWAPIAGAQSPEEVL